MFVVAVRVSTTFWSRNYLTRFCRTSSCKSSNQERKSWPQVIPVVTCKLPRGRSWQDWICECVTLLSCWTSRTVAPGFMSDGLGVLDKSAADDGGADVQIFVHGDKIGPFAFLN